MNWISIDNPPEINEKKELEIAFFDGVLMCRTFGAYTENGWYSYGFPFDEEYLTLTHWKEPFPLPEPPEDV